jgi:hypothetical protein
MSTDWEQQLRDWGRPPGPPEQTRMENTESQVRAALLASAALKGHNWKTKGQGSFYNLTHIPRESDVDIRVISHDAMFVDWTWVDPRGNSDSGVRAALNERFGLPGGAALYGFFAFRDDVGEALVARFGEEPNVTPGDKAFRIRESRYNVDSDVVACIEHRLYRSDGTYEEGVQFISRNTKKHITNFPEQQNRNGITKNHGTGERFKAMVRALKNLRAEMDDQLIPEAADIPSFLIECLVYNVPNDLLGRTQYYDDMKNILAHIYLNTKDASLSAKWLEESELKYLFGSHQSWTQAQAAAFALAAWHHVGFKD